MNEETINAILKFIAWMTSVLVCAVLIAVEMLRRYRTYYNPGESPTIEGELMTLIIKNDHPPFGLVVTPPVVKDSEGEIIPIDTAIESTNGNTLALIRDENDPNRAAFNVGASGDAAIFVKFSTKEGQVIKVLGQTFHVTHGDPKNIEGGELTFLGLEDAGSDDPPPVAVTPPILTSEEPGSAGTDDGATTPGTEGSSEATTDTSSSPSSEPTGSNEPSPAVVDASSTETTDTKAASSAAGATTEQSTNDQPVV